MIDISLYRQRIGSFFPSISCAKRYKKGTFVSAGLRHRLSHLQFILCALVLTVIGVGSSLLLQRMEKSIKFYSYEKSLNFLSTSEIMNYYNPRNQLVGNFYGRYVNGNGKGLPKGVKVYHLNIRSLYNKVEEVKKITCDLKPHILGLSEVELNKNIDGFSLNKLKVPGYRLLLPKSWVHHDYARVAVYVKNNFDFVRVLDLEDDHLQTIWLKGGFKNSKHGFYCHLYREHSSNIGGSINAQRLKLDLLLSQWEKAVDFGNPNGVNDLFICGDMNLDCLNNNWLNPHYHLYSLSQLVQRSCNLFNICQIVKGITRSQFNSVRNHANVSCIDHIYTNVKFKCSQAVIESFGNSDHDLVGFVRRSKDLSVCAKTIRKKH